MRYGKLRRTFTARMFFFQTNEVTTLLAASNGFVLTLVSPLVVTVLTRVASPAFLVPHTLVLVPSPVQLSPLNVRAPRNCRE